MISSLEFLRQNKVMAQPRRLVLASTSRYRKELVARLGIGADEVEAQAAGFRVQPDVVDPGEEIEVLRGDRAGQRLALKHRPPRDPTWAEAPAGA